ncbi:MAG: flagellar motor stator protein MotA [Steroidobacteraceae bacterium]
MIQIIGSIVVLACVAVGFMIEGGKLLALWHPAEFLIIIGAAFGAFLTSNPIKVVKASLAGILSLFKQERYEHDDYVSILKLLYDVLLRIRKEGLMAIESDIDSPDGGQLFKKYPQIADDHHLRNFITDSLRLMVGGNLNPHEFESLLDEELETFRQEVHEPGHAVQRMADALPGFGIVAAVLGIVNTMASIAGADTASIGERVASALVGTFLGILVSYGFAGPLAAAMGHAANDEVKAFELVKMALVANVRGYVPAVAIEFARKLLFSDVRPSFADLEAQLKNKAAKA